MADIKMCDKCGGTFNPRGAWQSLQATSFVVEGGRQVRYDTTIELCGKCAIVPSIDGDGGETNTSVAIGTGRQLVDEANGIWRDPDWSFHVKRGEQWIGPFTTKKSALKWLHDESGSTPLDADEEDELRFGPVASRSMPLDADPPEVEP